MRTFQIIILLILFLTITFQTTSLYSTVYPVKLQQNVITKNNSLKEASRIVGISVPNDKILNAVYVASKQTGISEALLLTLMHTESTMNPRAVSSKNYKGLMQIPHSVYYEDANCLIGARILLEKLKITNGDYRKAIVLYKGWSVNNPEGLRQADKVISLSRKLKEAM